MNILSGGFLPIMEKSNKTVKQEIPLVAYLLIAGIYLAPNFLGGLFCYLGGGLTNKEWTDLTKAPPVLGIFLLGV